MREGGKEGGREGSRGEEGRGGLQIEGTRNIYISEARWSNG